MARPQAKFLKVISRPRRSARDADAALPRDDPTRSQVYRQSPRCALWRHSRAGPAIATRAPRHVRRVTTTRSPLLQHCPNRRFFLSWTPTARLKSAARVRVGWGLGFGCRVAGAEAEDPKDAAEDEADVKAPKSFVIRRNQGLTRM